VVRAPRLLNTFSTSRISNIQQGLSKKERKKERKTEEAKDAATDQRIPTGLAPVESGLATTRRNQNSL
jgi:hypothetical protein